MATLCCIFIAVAVFNVFIVDVKGTEPVLAYKIIKDYELIWNIDGSRADNDVSIWRPVEVQAGYKLLGDVAVESYSKPSDASLSVIALADDALKEPKDFVRLWWDKGSGAYHDVTIWRMNPHDGYTCLGDIAVHSHSKDNPPADKYRCVKTDYLTTGKFKAIWDDSGSGADTDAKLWSDTEEGNEGKAFFANTFTAQATHNDIGGKPYLLNEEYMELYTYTESSYNTSLVAIKIYEVSDYDRVWWDKGSGSDHDVSIFRGKSENYYSLGDHARNGYYDPSLLYVVKAHKSDALDAPTGWRGVWDDSGSGADEDIKIHYPICKAGYRGIGMVAKQSHSGNPTDDSIRCVKDEHTVEGSWEKIWNDAGSGADDDVTIYAAVANDDNAQGLRAMSAVKSHGDMDKTAYVLVSTHVQYIVGKPRTKYYLSNIIYDFDSSQVLSSTPETLARTVVENQGETEQSVARTLEYTYEETHDWSKEYGLEVGVESSITAGIPDIAESSISVSVTETTTTSWGESFTESKTDSIEVDIVVQPRSQKSATVQSTRYVMDLQYTATLVTEYVDGTQVTDENYSGLYQGAHIDEIYVIIGNDTSLDIINQ